MPNKYLHVSIDPVCLPKNKLQPAVRRTHREFNPSPDLTTDQLYYFGKSYYLILGSQFPISTLIRSHKFRGLKQVAFRQFGPQMLCDHCCFKHALNFSFFFFRLDANISNQEIAYKIWISTFSYKYEKIWQHWAHFHTSQPSARAGQWPVPG